MLADLAPMVMVALVAGDANNIWRFSTLIVALVLLALGSIALIRRKQRRTEADKASAKLAV